ncbi:hypothetical protein HRbin15_02136 [bacterium HR15]|nr:hypothetical protein HRbin15_02136 [bacterium HR15]
MRIDFEQVLARLPTISVTPPASASTTLHTPPVRAHLAPIETPSTPDTLNRRREQAQTAIREQREAVRERLLQIRMETLPALEQRWCAELQAEYDLDAIRAEWQAEWRDAFEKHGRQRFTLLAEQAQLPPNSERFKALQQQLNELDARWQQQDRELHAQLQARLQRVEQEIEVRLQSRRREFIHQVEQEVDQLMRQQPDLKLYLPPHETHQAPAHQRTLPAMNVSIQSIDLRPNIQQHEHYMREQTKHILRQVAREWAALKHYRLSDSPRARDATDEFLRYLEGRR